MTEDLTQVPQYYEEEDRKTEDVLAYLITKANDTIAAKISNINLNKISYDVDLITIDEKGKTKNVRYNASESKTLALTNEEMYKVIAFDEVKKGSTTSELKCAKVLFESDKIELFLFNNKELIIKKPNEKGISTMTPKFAFGFNKQLAAFCGDCSSLTEKTSNKEFKNNEESLIEFCKLYSKCE